MKLPRQLQDRVEQAVGESIVGTASVSGGCIGETAQLQLQDGATLFLKWNRPQDIPAGLFEAEAEALKALAATATVRVPQVLHVATDFIVLEWLQPGAATEPSWRRLGRDLAGMHRTRAATYGWQRSNYIGSLRQSNDRLQRWSEFWRDERLRPQLELAFTAGKFDAAERAALERVVAGLEDLLAGAEEDGASLLHGDLWSGNVHMMRGGCALIDPSIYYGHREVDLAMAQLFGGFDRAFYTGYQEEWPLLAGAARRVPIYQLYYVLVHVNLFGGSYGAQAVALARAING